VELGQKFAVSVLLDLVTITTDDLLFEDVQVKGLRGSESMEMLQIANPNLQVPLDFEGSGHLLSQQDNVARHTFRSRAFQLGAVGYQFTHLDTLLLVTLAPWDENAMERVRNAVRNRCTLVTYSKKNHERLFPHSKITRGLLVPNVQWERLLDALVGVSGCPDVIVVASWAERRYPKALAGRHTGANAVHEEDKAMQLNDVGFSGDEFLMDMIFTGSVTVNEGQTTPRYLLKEEDLKSEKDGRLAQARATDKANRLLLAAPPNTTAPISLDKLKKPALKSIAKNLGLKVPSRISKPKLVALVATRWPGAPALTDATVGKNKAKNHPTEKRAKDSTCEGGEPARDSGDSDEDDDDTVSDSDAGDEDDGDNDDDDTDDKLDTRAHCRKCTLAWDDSRCVARSRKIGNGSGNTYFTCLCGGGGLVCKSKKCSWAEGTYRSIVVFA
jgi:hypothetical protein